jgi:hypothetical protein
MSKGKKLVVRHEIQDLSLIPAEYRRIDWKALLEGIDRVKKEILENPVAGRTFRGIPGVKFWLEEEEEK